MAKTKKKTKEKDIPIWKKFSKKTFTDYICNTFNLPIINK